jgi:aldose 1-epimerase
MTDVVTLSAHGFDLEILPALGGSVAWLNWTGPDGRTVPLLRPSDADAIASKNPSRLACFPLVPFANRIAGSRFVFAGREHRLPVNRPPDPMAIHGFGFQAPWAVETVGEDAIRLTHAHRTPGSPFRYRAEQVFRLEPGRARIALAVTHEGADPMPYGIGLHPWLPRPPDTRLQFAAMHVFIPDESRLPQAPEPVGPAVNFALPRCAAEVAPLDACFAGWNGQADVRWPEKNCGVMISADGAFCALHLFVPDDRPVLCVEPVSHVPNVHNRPDWAAFGPLHTLQQGESLRGGMAIRPVAL